MKHPGLKKIFSDCLKRIKPDGFRGLVIFTILSMICCSPSAFAIRATKASEPRVLILYVDGLRPDTIDEMVAEGKLPVIEKLFYKKGARFKHFFTGFPSNTVISNGAFMTGKEPWQTGIKSQAFFERYRTESKHWYNWIWPWGMTRFPHQMNLLANPEKIPGLLHRTDTKAIYDYLGEGYHPTIVPINPYPAPIAWPHVAANAVDNVWHVTHDAADNFDEINGEYALNYMLTDTKAQVFLVWFPSLDEDQHRLKSGQFGEARERMVSADQWLGKMTEALKKKYPNLYVLVFSDHGAIGGKDGVYNQPYYLGKEFFYEGLKMNVQGPDYSMTYPGTNPRAFVYVDNMGRGQAKIYLPVADISRADWNRPNTFYELTHYGRGPNRAPVNLVENLIGINLEARNELKESVSSSPVDLLFVKISETLIYARSTTRGESLIKIEEGEGGTLFRYIPVTGFSQDKDGTLHYEETLQGDAFGYLEDAAFAGGSGGTEFIKNAHTSRAWLEATYETAYPDAVPALARFFRWDERLRDRAASQDPDIVLSAMPGWNFRSEDVSSADHGYIARDSLRATLLIHGPGVTQGRMIEKPYRMAQLTPTIFKMVNYKKKTSFTEEAIHEIYDA